MIEFEDQFEVPAAPEAVMQRFMDVERVAQCVPGVTLHGRDADGNHLGTMAVAFGPKRLKFDGRLRCEFDPVRRTGVLSGGGMAAGRSAAVKVRTQFAVLQAPGSSAGAPRAQVRISSRADLQGVLAAFASTGGAVLARQLMGEFAAALTAQLTTPQPPAAAPAAALSAGGLLWRTLLGWLRALRRPRAGATACTPAEEQTR